MGKMSQKLFEALRYQEALVGLEVIEAFGGFLTHKAEPPYIMQK